MNDYKIRFTIDGLITIEAETEEEAVEKYQDLPWAEVFEKGYGFSQEAEVLEVIEKPKKIISPYLLLKNLFWIGWDIMKLMMCGKEKQLWNHFQI